MTLIRPDNTKVHGVFIYCGFYALLYWKLISEVFITVELNKYHIIQLVPSFDSRNRSPFKHDEF